MPPPKSPFAQPVGRSIQIIQTNGSRYVPPSQLWKPPADDITGINTTGSWWTAGQPVRPIAPASTGPVGLQFLSEQNKIFTPRATEYLTFDDLRRLATYPLAAMMITLYANAIAARQFRIRLRSIPGMNNNLLVYDTDPPPDGSLTWQVNQICMVVSQFPSCRIHEKVRNDRSCGARKET